MSCPRCLGAPGAGPAFLRIWRVRHPCPAPLRAECQDCGALHHARAATLYPGIGRFLQEDHAGSMVFEAWGTVAWDPQTGLHVRSEPGDELAERGGTAQPSPAGRPCPYRRADAGSPSGDRPKDLRRQLGI